MSVITPVLLAVYHVVAGLSAVLVPLLGGAGPAAAIVVFTASVRLCLHPLNRAQMRAQVASQAARAALAPAIQKITRKYKNDPARIQRETFELYRANGVSLAPGILQGLAQAPVFFVVYRMFEMTSIGGHRNALLNDRLFGVQLGSRFADVFRGPALVPGHVAVFAVLLVVIGAIATWSSVRMRKSPMPATAPVSPSDPSSASAARLTRIMAWMPYATLVTAAVLPLATGLYLATTTLWTVVERRHLQRVVATAAA